MSIKLAINISFLFKERPFLERFDAAASAGFKAVEWGAEIPDQYSIQELVAAREKAGVSVIGLCTPAGVSRGEKGYASLPGREDDFKASLSKAIEYAVALKCPRIHVLSGILNDSISADQAEEKFLTNIQMAADECAKHGITVLIEPLSAVPNYFLHHQEQAVELIKKAGRSNIKIEFDTFHAQYLGDKMMDFMQNNLEYIGKFRVVSFPDPPSGHIQISQIPERHEPSDDGTINFTSFFKKVKEIGYDGCVAGEYYAAAINISYLFKERPFLDRFDAAASAGFKAVEWGSSVPEQHTIQEIVEAKEKAGVEVVGLCTPAGISHGEKGYAALPERENDFKASLGTAIKYAVAVKCPRIHVLAGLLNDTISTDKAEETFITNIRQAADECAKHSITVLIEPLIDSNYFLCHQDQAIDLIKKIGRPNVKIEFDTFHAPYLGDGMIDFVRGNLQYIGHIQISQLPDRNEPGGNGTINFSSFFKGIEEAGYEGWVAGEYFATGTTEDGLGWAKPYLKDQ